MKQLFLALVLVFGLGLVAQAQDKPVIKRTFFSYDLEMTKLLNFTPEQMVSWEKIHSSAEPAIKRVKEDSSMTEEDRKEKLNSLWAERYKKQEALLTPEQKTRANEIKLIIKKQNEETQR